MAPPKVVGVLLKKPGQETGPWITALVQRDSKVRGELYVENLGQRRIVSIRMGWLWVEDTPMRLALRALNLRQAPISIRQPHALAFGFTLSDPQGNSLATFWADTEAIYWSWVRAIAAELVRQTPFRAQRCLNFLEILSTCPTRRRSRSELRSWLNDREKLEPNRTRSELRGWSSSNSSDEDPLSNNIPKDEEEEDTRVWACSESSEGSDDSLPWATMDDKTTTGTGKSTTPVNICFPIDLETREERIERYKEARRRENEARSKRVIDEEQRQKIVTNEVNNNQLINLDSMNDNNERRSRTRERRVLRNKNFKSLSCGDDDHCTYPIEQVAKLLERCQRVDHYVPVKEKLNLFESLSKLGRLARSTEDLNRSLPTPDGKQRARSLHDLNRGNKPLPVREMCRFFEGETSNLPCDKRGKRKKHLY